MGGGGSKVDPNVEAEWRRQKDAATAEAERLKRALDEAEKKAAKLTHEVEVLQAKAAAATTLSASATDLAGNAAEVQELTDQNESLKGQVEVAKKELDEARTALAAAKEDLSVLEDSTKQLREERKLHVDKIATLEASLASFSASAETSTEGHGAKQPPIELANAGIQTDAVVDAPAILEETLSSAIRTQSKPSITINVPISEVSEDFEDEEADGVSLSLKEGVRTGHVGTDGRSSQSSLQSERDVHMRRVATDARKSRGPKRNASAATVGSEGTGSGVNGDVSNGIDGSDGSVRSALNRVAAGDRPDTTGFTLDYSFLPQLLIGQKVMVARFEHSAPDEELPATVVSLIDVSAVPPKRVDEVTRAVLASGAGAVGWSRWMLRLKFVEFQDDEFDVYVLPYSSRLRPLDAEVFRQVRELDMQAADAVLRPQILPSGGKFKGSVSVSIVSRTPGATIRYTVDGRVPQAFDSVYLGPLIVDRDSRIIARAFRRSEGSMASGAEFLIES
eukprot:Opistho-2@80413